MSLTTHIQNWQKKKVLVIGDVGVDEYVTGPVRRISPEAPVPILEVESEDIRLGLAANVAQNILSLGGEAHLIGVVGLDQGFQSLKGLLQKQNVSAEHLFVESGRATTRKMRVMSGPHHLVRVDYEVQSPIGAKTEVEIVQRCRELLPQVSAVIIQDYAKGVITSGLLTLLFDVFRKYKTPVLVDPHRSHRAEFYKGCDLIKPNWDESLAMIGSSREEWRGRSDAAQVIGQKILADSQAKHLVLTRGAEGMSLFSGGLRVDIPTAAQKVFDVTGAGDTVIATLGLAYGAATPLADACRLANFAAGVVVGQVGCVPCTLAELENQIQVSQAQN